VVVGPAGETIYPDEYGRVKVQFFWDRHGKKDEHSSCWVRVSHAWAGQGWGSLHIPHVGQEVIVAFEYGDVDRPIIVGRVYNAEQQIPLSLPDDKEKCIILGHGGNKMLWNDKDGEQKMEMFSPTENSYFSIGEGCMHQETDGDHILKIKADRDDKVDGNEKRKVGVNCEEEIGGNKKEEVGGFWNTLVDGSREETICGPVKAKWDGVSAKFHAGAATDWYGGLKHGTFVGVNLATNLSANITKSAGVKYTYSDAGEKKTSSSKVESVKTVYAMNSKIVKIEGSSDVDIGTKTAYTNYSGSTITIDNGAGSSIELSGSTVTIKCSTLKFECSNAKFTGNVVGSRMFEWG